MLIGRVRRSVRAVGAVLWCAAAAGLSAGAPAQEPNAAPREPSSIVNVHVRHLQDWAAIEAAGGTPLVCRHGVGWSPVYVEAGALKALRDAGFETAVLVDDADAMVAANRRRIDRHLADRGANWFDDFKDMAAINSYMDDLVAVNPAIASKLLVGNSLEGRPIYALRITGAGGGDKPAVLFNGTQHAREWVAPMVTVYIADQLIRTYSTDPQVQALVDGVEFFIVPVMNPDGYVYSWTTERFWRKNRRNNGDGSFGVDLNRNFPTDFGGPYASSVPSSETYHGPFAISEPESVVMDDFIAARPNVVAHIDYHSYATEILQPYGYTNTLPPFFSIVDDLGAQMSAAIQAVNGTFYPHASGAGGVGLASGIFPDWTTDGYRAYGYTIELPGPGFDPSPAIIVPVSQENFAGALVLAEWAMQQPAMTIEHVPPALLTPGLPTPITATAEPVYSGPVDTGSAKVLYQTSSRGAFSELPMTHLGNNEFEAMLPAVPCGTTVEYYVQIDAQSGSSFTAPIDAPTALFAATAADVVVDDDFETDLGWTTDVLGATSGQWQRGVPVDDPSWAYDPVSDGDGSGQCWLTQNTSGNTDVDNGSVVLNSPVLDLSGNGAADQWTVSYFYYLNLNNDDGSDRLLVEANDGDGAWIEVARHDTNGGTAWRTHSITGDELTAAGLTLTADMQFRFTCNDADPQSIVEAGLDGFRIISDTCGSAIPGDLVAPFGVVDVFDLFELLNNWGADGPGANLAEPTDVVDVFDLFVLLGNWG